MRQYEISRSSYRCTDCQRELAAQEEFVAAVRTDEQEDDLLRQDYCLECWARRGEAGADVLGVWHTRVPPPTAKKKLFVDDELLVSFFERLEGADDGAKLCFRYVLALVLMRKKRLVYDRARRLEDGTEIWQMHFKGSDRVHEVLDPKMDEQNIAQVSGQLGQILEGEL